MEDIGRTTRTVALEQAVIYANAQAHAVRKTPEEIVAAAQAFAKFLEAPAEE